MTTPNIEPEDVTTPPGEAGLTSDPDDANDIPPISQNLEQSGTAQDDSGEPHGTPANQMRSEEMPATPAHGDEPGGSADTLVTPDPSVVPDSTGRATPTDPTPVMDAAPGDTGDLTGEDSRSPQVANAVPGHPDGEVDTRT